MELASYDLALIGGLGGHVLEAHPRPCIVQAKGWRRLVPVFGLRYAECGTIRFHGLSSFSGVSRNCWRAQVQHQRWLARGLRLSFQARSQSALLHLPKFKDTGRVWTSLIS